MRELIIKVDDPGERAWDGSSKVFEIKELVRCKDCKHKGDPFECILDSDLEEHGGHRTDEDDTWFCADGEVRT